SRIVPPGGTIFFSGDHGSGAPGGPWLRRGMTNDPGGFGLWPRDFIKLAESDPLWTNWSSVAGVIGPSIETTGTPCDIRVRTELENVPASKLDSSRPSGLVRVAAWKLAWAAAVSVLVDVFQSMLTPWALASASAPHSIEM